MPSAVLISIMEEFVEQLNTPGRIDKISNDDSKPRQFLLKGILTYKGSINSMGTCGPKKAILIPFILISDTESDGTVNSKGIAINMWNDAILQTSKILYFMRRRESDRYNVIIKCIVNLITELCSWPICFPLSQLSGFGMIGDFAYVVSDYPVGADSATVIPTASNLKPTEGRGIRCCCNCDYPRIVDCVRMNFQQYRKNMTTVFQEELTYLYQYQDAVEPSATRYSLSITNEPNTKSSYEPVTRGEALDTTFSTRFIIAEVTIPPLVGVTALKPSPSGSALLMHSPLFAKFVINAPIPNPNTDFHFALCLLLKVPVVDRTSTFTNPWVKVKVLDPLHELRGNSSYYPKIAKIGTEPPKQATTKRSDNVDLPHNSFHKYDLLGRSTAYCKYTGLETITNETAQSIISKALHLYETVDQANGHPCTITLMWSGGIDSTVALVALLKALKDREKPAEVQEKKSAFRLFGSKPATLVPQTQITFRIVHSKASIIEFPAMYASLNRLIKRHYLRETTLILDLIPTDAEKAEHMNLTYGLTVTGEYGDQLFGSILMHGAFKKKPNFIFTSGLGTDLNMEWKAAVQKNVTDKKMFESQAVIDAFMGKLVEQASHNAFPIITIFDWLWWVNFSMKWQYVGLRMLTRVQDLNTQKAERLEHFYHQRDFQLWAMDQDNHPFKLPLRGTNRIPTGLITWKNYKALLKAYIHDTYSTIDKKISGSTSSYFSNKEKQGSLRHKSAGDFAMDDDYNMIRFGGYSVNPELIKYTYGSDGLLKFIQDDKLPQNRME